MVKSPSLAFVSLESGVVTSVAGDMDSDGANFPAREGPPWLNKLIAEESWLESRCSSRVSTPFDAVGELQGCTTKKTPHDEGLIGPWVKKSSV